MGHCGPGPEFKFSKTVEVGCCCTDLELGQREIATNEIQERKKYRERSNIKWVSVHWRAQCHTKWPRGCKEFQHPRESNPSRPTHWKLPWPLSHEFEMISQKKRYMTRRISQPGTSFLHAGLSFSECSGLIYQGQTRNTRILERRPLINTSYRIQHRLELEFFLLCTSFAHLAAHRPRKREI